jgi:autotransporter-associated beta strand protein
VDSSLLKLGAGTLELAGANTFSGTTTVLEGSLLVTSPGTLVSTSLTLAQGGTLLLNPGVHLPPTILNGAGSLFLQPQTVVLTGGVFSGTILFASGVPADFGMRIDPDASVTLSGTHLFSGTLYVGSLSPVVKASTLLVGTSSLTDGSGNVSSGPAGAGKVWVVQGSTLSAASGSWTLHNEVLWEKNSFAGLAGTLAINGKSVFLQTDKDAGNIALGVQTGAVGILNNVSDLQTVADASADWSFTKIGAGTLVLGGPLTTKAARWVVTGGSLRLQPDVTWSPTVGKEIKLDGGTIRYGGGISGDLSSKLTLVSGSFGGVEVMDGESVTFASVISGGTGARFVKMGAGTLVMGTGNAFDGISLAGGTFSVGTLEALGTGGITFLGGTLRFAPGFSGDASPRFAAPFGEAISVDVGTQRLTFSSPLIGSGGLQKLGVGNLYLPIPSPSISGALDLVAGVLNIADSTALGSAGLDGTVRRGATLQLEYLQAGVNTLAAGQLVLQAGAAPGQSGGLVNLSGNNFFDGTLSAGQGILAGTLSVDGGVLLVKTLSFANNANASSYLDGRGAGLIQSVSTGVNGYGNLIKQGPGTWTLTAQSAFQHEGQTAVRGGSLIWDLAETPASAALVSVAGSLVFAGGALVIKGGSGASTFTAVYADPQNLLWSVPYSAGDGGSGVVDHFGARGNSQSLRCGRGRSVDRLATQYRGEVQRQYFGVFAVRWQGNFHRRYRKLRLRLECRC